MNNDFQENKEPTIGAAFLTQKMAMEDITIKFEIWDTAGQERFHSLAPMYYRNAQAAVIVYDVTKPQSFEKAKTWVKELHRQASPGITICLVGNKIDLVHDSSEDGADGPVRLVSEQDAKEYAMSENLIFVETSAKTGQGVNSVFEEIAKKIPRDLLASNAAKSGRRDEGRVDLGSNAETGKQESACAC